MPGEVYGPGALVAGRYRIVGLLGRGGLAAVYRAKDELLHRKVALKVFDAGAVEAADLARRRNEMLLLARLSHPGLVTLYDAGVSPSPEGEAVGFLAIELVEGTDLRARLAHGALGAAEIAVIGTQIAEALAYVHERGIVHRDVKPGNILLQVASAGTERARLADFGIARLADQTHVTRTNTIVGTAAYLSPEQASGSAVGPATDVYSLGLVLLECLTGAQEFPGPAVEAALARMTRDPVIPEGLGEPFAALLPAMTARNPEDRPPAAHVARILSQPLARAAAPTVRLSAVPPRPARRPGSGAHRPSREPLVPRPSAAQETNATLADLTLPASKAPGAGSGSAPLRRRARSLSLFTAAALAVAVLAVVLLGVFGHPGPRAVPTPTPMPALSGDLGQHMGQLEKDLTP